MLAIRNPSTPIHSVFIPLKKKRLMQARLPVVVNIRMNFFLLPPKSAIPDNTGETRHTMRYASAMVKAYKEELDICQPNAGMNSSVIAIKKVGNIAVEITRLYEELAQSNITQPKIALLSSFIFVQLAGKIRKYPFCQSGIIF